MDLRSEDVRYSVPGREILKGISLRVLVSAGILLPIGVIRAVLSGCAVLPLAVLLFGA